MTMVGRIFGCVHCQGVQFRPGGDGHHARFGRKQKSRTVFAQATPDRDRGGVDFGVALSRLLTIRLKPFLRLFFGDQGVVYVAQHGYELIGFVVAQKVTDLAAAG